jgi:hypothetical protein
VRKCRSHNVVKNDQNCSLTFEYIGFSEGSSPETPIQHKGCFAGEHTVRLSWENVHTRLAVRIAQLEVQRLGGPDNNENGVKDWIEASVAAMSGVDGVSQASLPADVPPTSSRPCIESYISPACIEGDARYVPFMQIVDDASCFVPVAQSAGSRWFANLPLD